jgi:hypothetical protein
MPVTDGNVLVINDSGYRLMVGRGTVAKSGRLFSVIGQRGYPQARVRFPVLTLFPVLGSGPYKAILR